VENNNQDQNGITGLEETIPTNTLSTYSPNNPPWNSLQAFLLWVLSVVLIIVSPIIFLTPYIASVGINPSEAETFANFITKDQTAILLQLLAIIPAHIITLVAAWFLITRYKKYSFRGMLGWDWGGYNWWQTALVMLSMLILVFCVAYLTNFYFGKQDNDFLKILRSSRYAVFIVAFMATFSAPVVEEIVYRGVLYSAFQRTFNIPIAVLLVTAVFAVVHFPQYWGDFATLTTLTFLSLLITLLRVKTNSLLPCILFHFLINGIQSILLILQPYLPETLDATQVEGFFYHLIF
jgi:membrane protease YdiL (CAAX protease family)